MKLKTVEVEGKTYADLNDGKPVYIDDKGKEHSYDAPAMRNSLDRLNGVLNEERTAKAAAEEALTAFGDLNAEEARKALDVVKNLDDKKLIDAGEVERIKAATAEAFQNKLDEANGTIDQLQSQYAGEKINAAFAGSKFVTEKLAIPGDMAQAAFAKHFQFKDGRLNPVDQNGNPIYSDSNPAEVATFDEALEKLVNVYPHRDRILKGTGAGGSGAGGMEGDGSARTITRSQFDALPPVEQQKYAASAAKNEVKIID